MVNSYKDLCSILNLDYTYYSTSKENQEQELKNYMKFTKKGRKYNITAVYPIEKAIKNKKGALFSNQLYYNFFAFLTFYFQETSNFKLILTPIELALALNYINPKFKINQYNKENKAKIAKNIDNQILKENVTNKPYLKKIKSEINQLNANLEQKQVNLEQKQNAVDLKNNSDFDFVSKIGQQETEDLFSHIPDNYEYQIKSTLNSLEKQGVINLKNNTIGVYIRKKSNPTDAEFNEYFKDINNSNKKISEDLGIDLISIQQDLENGEITLNDLNNIYNEENFKSQYYYESRILTEEEEDKLLSIRNQVANELGFSTPFKASKSWKQKQYFDKIILRTRIELGILFTYKAYRITFYPEGLELQQNFYKEKIYLGKNINKSLTSFNKDFSNKEKQNKLNRLEKMTDIRYTKDVKKTMEYYFNALVDTYILIDYDDLGVNEGLSKYNLENWKSISKNSDKRLKSEEIPYKNNGEK